MGIYQAYNPKNKTWVKYKRERGKPSRIVDTKQKEPNKPFKGVKKRGNRK